MSGTAIAQALPIAATPILTRYYTPLEFGFFGFFIGIVSLLSVLATAKYDVAIIQPKKNIHADQLFKLSMLLVFIFSVLLLVLILFNTESITTALDIENINYVLFLVPYTVFVVSANNSLNFLLNRRKLYKQMSINKVIQSLSIASISLILGFLHYSSYGLIIGFIIGHTLVFINLIYRYWNSIEKIDYSSIIILAKEYKDYPKFALPSGLSNTAASQLPVILLTKIFNSSISGFYYLVEKILSAPITLLGASVGAVFRQKAQEDKHLYGNYNDIFKKTFSKLVMIGLPMFLLLGIFGPDLFSFAFGENWREAGIYAQILAPMFFLKFTVSPLLSSFYISNKLKVDLLGQIVYVVMIVISIATGYFINSIILTITMISITGSLFYLVFFFITYNYSKNNNKVQV